MALHYRKLMIFAAIAGILSACSPSDPTEKLVNDTLKKMTLEEKAGQMVQITLDNLVVNGELSEDNMQQLFGEYKIGSILNVYGGHSNTKERFTEIVTAIQDKSMELIGIPCIFGLDMIHGATYLNEGTFFPQEINLGASFNPYFAFRLGEVTAYESRAAQCPWVFSPVMDLGRDPRWSRQWESWGEDPYLQGVMAQAETIGAQGGDGKSIDEEHVAVSLKHYIGYGVPVSGKDRTPAIITDHELREKFFRPFKLSIQAGAQTIMVNSASINGVPTHANKKLLTGWLKDDLKWDGFAVTDWADINNLFTREHIAADLDEALELGINAGIDMIMEPYNPAVVKNIVELVKQGRIPQSRIDDAVKRILRVKARLGLFENPVVENDYSKFGCDEFVETARRAAIESEVLLKNEGGILPLAKSTKIFVTGPNANSMRSLNGGWSYTWQGSADPKDHDQFNTILEALQTKFTNVTYAPGVKYIEHANWQDEDPSGIAEAARMAKNADVCIVCIGENSYCETPGNMDDLTISKNQIELVKAVAASGKPVVLILNEGRPRIISAIEPLAQAVVDVLLPSNFGGDALAALLCGEENFSAKLPLTYPKHVHSLHTYDYKVSEKTDAVMEGMYNYDAVMDVQWPFGTGLSYTTFEYSNLQIDKTEFTADDVLTISVDVKNTGSVDGKEAVIVYSSDLVASLVPDVKRVRAFEKVDLKAGEQTTVKLQIPAYELAFVGIDGKWRLEKGDFRIAAGGLGQIVKCTKTKVWDTPNID